MSNPAKRILLIEDNPEVRENTSELLELSDYEVTAAQNGKEGVNLAKSEKPDLIICDIMMPELDGHGVLHLLNKSPETASIPFIFLTAKTERTDLRKGMEMGADDYLTKPFSEMELLNAIESRLKKHDILKKEFSHDADGMKEFIDQAKAMEDLREISEEADIITIKPKEEIYHEGAYPKFLYLIDKGKVKTYRTHEAGKDYITDLYNEGDFLGYTALLQDQPFEETAIALEETDVYKIPKTDFFKLVYNNRDVANKFIKMLSNSILEKEERLINLAYDSVRKRVAESLVYIHDKYKEESEDDTRISITREDLASVVGTAKETVIRTLSEFKEDGFIEIQGRKIRILEKEKLKNLIY